MAELKTGFVALIGRPNVGKSTLMNRLIGQKIAITSNKPQTTRNRIQTVYTEERGQIIFLDTPGIHKAKNKLGEYMVNAAKQTMNDVDVVLWLVEPTTYIGAGEQQIAANLKNCKKPVILVINKVDTVKKEEILKFIDAYKNIVRFDEIVPVSALKGKALRCLSDEIPHGIAVTIERMRERTDGSNIIDIDATIVCERDSHKGIIIGKGGEMLKKIGSAARFEIERMMDMQVNLKLWVKVKKEWRDNDLLMKNYGYDEKALKK